MCGKTDVPRGLGVMHPPHMVDQISAGGVADADTDSKSVTRPERHTVKRSPHSQLGEEQMLTAADVADRINSSVRTVRGLIADGELKAVRFGRSVRIEPPDLRKLIRRKRKK